MTDNGKLMLHFTLRINNIYYVPTLRNCTHLVDHGYKVFLFYGRNMGVYFAGDFDSIQNDFNMSLSTCLIYKKIVIE